LASTFFQNVTEKSAIDQALDILHEPDQEYGAFWKRAYGIPEQFMKDGGINVLFNMLLDLSL
jgi:RNA polymerase-interacting CarD/CdnL/TRCF family regulator